MAVIFEVTFHSPFRVASGRAGDGANSTVDTAALLPASTLKGLMRSAARDVLRLPEAWVRAVFGANGAPSPWSWSDAELLGTGRPADGAAAGHTVRLRARIQIDEETASVARGALAIAEEVLAHGARFTVTRSGWIPGHAELHQQILVAAARAVTAVGGDRRRGLGWVSVVPIDPPWSPEMAGGLVTALLSLPSTPPATVEVPR